MDERLTGVAWYVRSAFSHPYRLPSEFQPSKEHSLLRESGLLGQSTAPALLDNYIILPDEEASNWGLLIMMKVLPMMFTVPTPWNILVGEAGCASVVEWLVDFCGRRRLGVMNARNLCRKFILIGRAWWLGGLYNIESKCIITRKMHREFGSNQKNR